MKVMKETRHLATEDHAMPARPGLVHALLLGLVLVWWGLAGVAPRGLPAAEVDALEGGVRLAEALTATPSSPLRKALVEGARTYPDYPRLAERHVSGPSRDVLIPPAPRWLAAIGVMLAPVPEATSNGRRASLLAALVAGVALAVVVAGRSLPTGLVLVGLAGSSVVFQDALTGFGYASVGLLASSLVLLGLGATARAASRGLASLALPAGLALALGTHPFAAGLLLVPWLLPVGRTGGQGAALPWGRLLAPLAALGLLVALWPSLWSSTSAGLGAWLLTPGLDPGATVEVLSETFDPAAWRGPQAFTTMLQLVTALPLPLLCLAIHGAVVDTAKLHAPLLCLGALLGAAGLDGGLFGARLNLPPLLLPPLLLCAAASLERLGAHARRIGVLAVVASLALRAAGAGTELAIPGGSRLEVMTGTPTDPPSAAARVAAAVVRDHLERRD
jgi:hypothetical protein